MDCSRDRRIGGSTQFAGVAYPHCRGNAAPAPPRFARAPGMGYNLPAIFTGDCIFRWSYWSAKKAWLSSLTGCGARSRVRGALLCLARKREWGRRRSSRHSPRHKSARACYGAVAMRCSRLDPSDRYTTSRVRHRANSWPPSTATQIAKSYSRRPLASWSARRPCWSSRICIGRTKPRSIFSSI
jgi:hypothetical protein